MRSRFGESSSTRNNQFAISSKESCARFEICSFEKKSKLAGLCKLIRFYTRAQGTPSIPPDLGQPCLLYSSSFSLWRGADRPRHVSWADEASLSRIWMRGFLCVNGQASELDCGALRCFFFIIIIPPLSVALPVHRSASPFSQYWRNQKYWNKRNNFLEALLKLHLVGERNLVVNLPGWKRRGEGVTGCKRERCSRSLRKACRLSSKCH